jgi:hypothetical protein
MWLEIYTLSLMITKVFYNIDLCLFSSPCWHLELFVKVLEESQRTLLICNAVRYKLVFTKKRIIY